jgi:hypothetical protein
MSRKVKTRGLTRAVVLPAGLLLFLSAAHAGDILIESGPGQDTLIMVGPGVVERQTAPAIRMESDPENDAVMSLEPDPSWENAGRPPEIGPVIIAPEIRVRAR